MFVAAAFLLIAIAVVVRRHEVASPARPARIPLSYGLVRDIAAAANDGQVAVHDARLDEVLTHRTAHGRWRLALAHRRGEACWVLLDPFGRHDGACGSAHSVDAGPVIAYLQEERLPLRSATATIVVYGLVTSAVRSLDLTLSDCTQLPVSIRTRPLFWQFVSAHRNQLPGLPRGVLARLFDGRKVAIRFARPKPTETRCQA